MQADLATAPTRPIGPGAVVARPQGDAGPTVRRTTFGTPAGKPPSWPRAERRSDPGEIRFRHAFSFRVFGEPEPLQAVAQIRAHRGEAEIDSVTLIRPGNTFVTCLPGTPLFRLAKSEILRREVGAIRRRAFELATVGIPLSAEVA